MNCPNCNQENDNDNIFCVSCGGNLAPPINSGVTTQPSPTQYYTPSQINKSGDAPDSVQTVFPSAPNFNSAPPFDSSIPYLDAPAQRKGNGKFILLGALALLLLVGAGIGAFFIFNKQTASAEILPDHLGLFVQNQEKNAISEISKRDIKNILAEKDELLKNESLSTVDAKPNLILYADSKDIPLTDLKLVQLDTIKDDGTLKHIEYQPSYVEGKPEIKRLRVPDGLANGKYAFALFGAFLDEGEHKLWAFQVKNAAKTDNGDLAKTLTLSMKPKNAPSSNTNTSAANTTTAANTMTAVKVEPTPKTETAAPAGARVAYCSSSNVIMRASPSLTARKVNGLRRGQKIYVINYSNNYDYWNGMEGNWAYVQTESGGRGWVFTPLISY